MLSGTSLTWQAASVAASALTDSAGQSGYLATITNPAELAFINSSALFSSAAWIGASTVSSNLVWSTGPEATSVIQTSTGCTSFCAFAPGQPGSLSSNKCLFMSSPSGRWSASPCSTTLPNYIVEFGPYLGTNDCHRSPQCNFLAQVGCRMARSTRSLPVRASGCFGPLVLPVVVRPCHAQ